ncbi:MAG TPA: cupin domain-containing protein [Bryobacteraceae bacterium]|jgi:quercetin dioxygenase-like cupin family protein|nr:cupin domain-containing protein [Bryobacteraceae bacterium]
MEPRFNHFKAAPDTYKALSGLETYLHGGGRRVSSKPMLVLAFLITSTLIIISPLMAQETITPLMSHALAEVSGKEVLMYTVGFPPGFSSPVHRHNAQVSLYVLEGSVVMQVKGGKEITLRPGQSFYENPNDIHTVSRNASSTKPAKFLVFLIKKKGAPLVIPAK